MDNELKHSYKIRFVILGSLLFIIVFGVRYYKSPGLVSFFCHGSDGGGQYTSLIHLIEQEKQAHLGKNPELIVSAQSPNYRNISAGKLSKPSSDSSVAIFRKYFKNSDFIKWENEQQPIITFSDDSSMAYAIIQKEVMLKGKKENKIEDTHFIWVAIYKKYDHQWKRDCVISTNRD